MVLLILLLVSFATSYILGHTNDVDPLDRQGYYVVNKCTGYVKSYIRLTTLTLGSFNRRENQITFYKCKLNCDDSSCTVQETGYVRSFSADHITGIKNTYSLSPFKINGTPPHEIVVRSPWSNEGMFEDAGQLTGYNYQYTYNMDGEIDSIYRIKLSKCIAKEIRTCVNDVLLISKYADSECVEFLSWKRKSCDNNIQMAGKKCMCILDESDDHEMYEILTITGEYNFVSGPRATNKYQNVITWGMPTKSDRINKYGDYGKYGNLLISFNETLKLPNYSLYIYRENIKCSKSRIYDWTVTRKAYKFSNNNGIDQGHLTPASDISLYCEAANSMLNIVPQVHTMNNGVWKSVENKVRRDFKNHIIYTGCEYDDHTVIIDKDGNSVPKPIGLYKIVFDGQMRIVWQIYIKNIEYPGQGVRWQDVGDPNKLPFNIVRI